MSGTHNKIIAETAKEALKPLGLRRKGQSRLWFADHGWWLTIVEFQPSGLSAGSYLNVAAHWLWSDQGFISFDLGSGTEWGSRVSEFEAYRSDDQFRAAASRLAAAAAQEAQKLALSISSIDAAAGLLLSHERDLRPQSRGSWPAYNAAVAAGLANRKHDAKEMFQSITDKRVMNAAERFKSVSSAVGFEEIVVSLVASQRQALRLPEMNRVQF